MGFHYDTQTYGTQSAEQILPIVFSLIGTPKSVLDVGCGNGSWLKVAHQIGVVECLGIDGEHVTSNEFIGDYTFFKPYDLQKPLNLNRKYDLVISLEVAEHLPESAADTFVENLTKHADTILFSAAIPYQGGYMHLNEKYPSYWLEKFSEKGFMFYDLVRSFIWDKEKILPWYKQNIFLIGNANSILAEKFTPTKQMLNVIHPEIYEQKALQAQRAEQMEKGQLGLQIAFRSLFFAIKNKIWRNG